jgi:hypothetical protein
MLVLFSKPSGMDLCHVAPHVFQAWEEAEQTNRRGHRRFLHSRREAGISPLQFIQLASHSD